MLQSKGAEMSRPIIVDSHEDISWNKIALNRDFLETVAAKRAREGDKPWHKEGSATVGLADLLAANVRVVFATIYVAKAAPNRTAPGKTYTTAQEAHDQAMEHIAYYASLAIKSDISIITSRQDLDIVIDSNKARIGLVLLMEGADPIIAPENTQEWFDAGVRIVGPAWSQTRYSGGTHAPGPLTELGRELIPQLERSGLILDVSHMAEESFFQALDLFHGTVIASHSNCRAYVNTDRQLSDEMIRAIVARDGVIGTVIYNRFLKEGWDKAARKAEVKLADAVRHVQHICDIAGNTRHVGIGTDFDGGFGMESTPDEIDSVADLPKLGEALARAGFKDEDVRNYLGGNWLRVLEMGLPE
jgi:membrane dipeptidase